MPPTWYNNPLFRQLLFLTVRYLVFFTHDSTFYWDAVSVCISAALFMNSFSENSTSGTLPWWYLHLAEGLCSRVRELAYITELKKLCRWQQSSSRTTHALQVLSNLLTFSHHKNSAPLKPGNQERHGPKTCQSATEEDEKLESCANPKITILMHLCFVTGSQLIYRAKLIWLNV